MGAVHINFIGPWRVILGVKTVTVNVTSIDEVRDYVERNFGPPFEEKLKAMGVSKKQSIWENSNILLNGKNIKMENGIVLRDGDTLDMLPMLAGG